MMMKFRTIMAFPPAVSLSGFAAISAQRRGDQLTEWEAFMRILPFEKRNGGWQ